MRSIASARGEAAAGTALVQDRPDSHRLARPPQNSGASPPLSFPALISLPGRSAVGSRGIVWNVEGEEESHCLVDRGCRFAIRPSSGGQEPALLLDLLALVNEQFP